jgi:phage-related protein
MPKTEVLIYADEGSAPLLPWMDALPVKVRDKLIVRIERLAEVGHELRRPEADFLRDGIHELRTRFQNVNYRILYFFHEQRAVLSHGCTKEDVVPPKEIDTAITHMQQFKKSPTQHTHEE